MSGMMAMMAGNVGSRVSVPDINLAWNNASDGYWFRDIRYVPGSGLTLNLNSVGTITSDGSIGGGPTAWYTGSPTGSNFEAKATFTSSTGPSSSTVLVGPSGSQTTITLGNTSAWYNLGSNILLTINQLSGLVEDTVTLTVVLRQVSLPSNSITKPFEFNWFT